MTPMSPASANDSIQRKKALEIRFAGLLPHALDRISVLGATGVSPRREDYVMIDGGIWANNPVMNALVDALACFDIPREDVRILSLGTGESTFTVDDRARNGGIKDWAYRQLYRQSTGVPRDRLR